LLSPLFAQFLALLLTFDSAEAEHFLLKRAQPLTLEVVPLALKPPLRLCLLSTSVELVVRPTSPWI
jgi:hypothetical protein